MTRPQVLRLAIKYHDKLNAIGHSPVKDTSAKSLHGRMNHIMWMCLELPRLSDESKLNRWLGFIQGVLSTTTMYTIDNMREQVSEIIKGDKE